jgi:hypothetical protein
LAATLGVLFLTGVNCDDSNGTPERGSPRRDEWRVEVDTEFPYKDSEGNVQIDSIFIGGGSKSSDNFVNRGDVIVKFDGEADRIKIEMRRFTWRKDSEEDSIQSDFDKTLLWAFPTSNLVPPDELPPEADCARRNPDDPDATFPWLNNCRVRVYYEGQIQPNRLGADLRVTLPSKYRHSVDVSTFDNTTEEDYENRSDVCLQNLNGTADVTLESGHAYVILNRETTPVPVCSAEEHELCEEWTVEGEPAAWAADCPCPNQGFGRVGVESQYKGAPNVTVDVPDGLWTSFLIENEGPNQTAEDHCDVQVDWDKAEEEDTGILWRKTGEANHPSDAAPAGAGFNVTMAAEECAPVRYTCEPEDFVGHNNADDQPTYDGGTLVLCSGCLEGKTCEELLACD